MQDRRKSRRQRTLKGGSIVFNYGAAIDCILRNVSCSGACLLVASPIGIPDQFEFVLSGDNSGYDCRTHWRSVDRIGVAFSHADRDNVAQVRSSTPEIEQHVTRITAGDPSQDSP